ncbi:GTPase Era, mitochondrial isoform X2 [Ceratina calcarata]|nr:GTPase Era, mitochondrial isoform X2 [Ceratina calcarata]
MSFTIRKCVFQRELHLLRRSFFNSTVLNGSNNQEELISESNADQQVHGGRKKLIRVAIIGLPNAGKSTLVNKLMHRSVCPTSSKVHTTMHKTEAIHTEGDTQIIFMDTPGLTKSSEMKTYKLSKTFKEDPENSISKADVVGILQDVTNVYTRHKFDKFVLEYLKNRREDTDLLLILNKVDKLKKKDALLEVTRLLTNKEDYPTFNDIFMVSALDGDGVDDLRNYLLDSAKEKDWEYEQGTYTDQPIEKLIEQTVRAQLMDILPYEMPYKVIINVEDFGVRDDDSIYAAVILDCPRSNYVTVMLKSNGFKVKCLQYHVEKDLRHALRTPVSLRLSVICSKSQHA